MDKKSKKEIYGKVNYSKEIVGFVKIFVIVVVILTLVYFLTQIANGEIKLGNSKKESIETMIQYEEIIAGEVLNRKEEEYFVMLFRFSDDNAGTLLSLKDGYKNVTDSLTVYIVDIEKGFNNILKPTDDEDIIDKPTNVESLKVKDNTLLKIKSGVVVERVTSDQEITNYFGNLAK